MRIAPFIELSSFSESVDLSAWPWWYPMPDGSDAIAYKSPTFICPSGVRELNEWTNGTHVSSLTSYLAVSGRNQFKEAGGQDGMIYVNSGVKMAEITDGTSQTYCVGEKYLNPDNYTNGADAADDQHILMGLDRDVNGYTGNSNNPLDDRYLPPI